VAALGLQAVIVRGLRLRLRLTRASEDVRAALGDGAMVGGAERADAHVGAYNSRHQEGQEVSLSVVVADCWRLNAPGRLA
jgi:hypothetical protein